MRLNFGLFKIKSARKANKRFEIPIIDNEIFGALNSSDISSHLSLLYFLVRLLNPSNLVELGTREGQSTRALRHAANELGIRGISIDLSPTPSGFVKNHGKWVHFQEDDIEFATKLRSEEFRKKVLGSNSIDFLFIDTSHEYLHTKQEIESYWPFLSKKSLIVLHDTNLSVSKKLDVDGRIYSGWNNSRGVTKAVEEFFDILIDEKSVFSKSKGDYVFYHLPWANGILFILKNR